MVGEGVHYEQKKRSTGQINNIINNNVLYI